MKPLILLILKAFLCLAFSPSLQSQTIYSQWASASSHVSTQRSPDGMLCTSLTCPTITSRENTVDNSLTNYSTVSFPLLSVGSSVTYTMDLSSTVTNGAGGGVYIQSSTNLVGLAVLPSFTVQLLNNSTVVGTASYGSLLNLQLLSQEGMHLCASSASPYNSVRLTISVPVGVSVPMQFRIYYAYGNSSSSCSNTILPAGLQRFQATALADCRVKIGWSSTIETNLQFYELQRQTKMAHGWTTVAKILPSSGVDGGEYEHVDYPETEGTVTYRLSTRDHDGAVQIFPSSVVRLDCAKNEIVLFPSVARDMVRLSVSEPQKVQQVLILDAMGKVQRIIKRIVLAETTIDVSGMPGGAYAVCVQNEHEMQVRRFVISR